MSPIQLLKETRARGFRSAWDSFRRRRHLLPIVAYIVLALTMAYSIGVERHHSNQNRNALAEETRQTLIQGCVRGNELRITLQGIIRNSAALNEDRIKAGLKSGEITPEQAKRYADYTQTTLDELGTLNCEKLYPPPEPAD